MHFSAGPSEHSWQPMNTTDTTSAHYWLNWKVCLCSIWILVSMTIASFLIWKYEGKSKSKEGEVNNEEDNSGILYEYEVWMPCLEVIHPVWLLVFRVLSFVLLLALLVTNVVINGASIFYYYTQWTFMLVTVYFGLGSFLSIHGCHQYLSKTDSTNIIEDVRKLDGEKTTYATAIKDMEIKHKSLNKTKHAGFLGYLFQIIYQTNAGAVMLTDCVFWFIIFPFLALKDYELNFILIGMHTVNAVFLLGDTALNSLRFPWFRISYFLLWTSGFVIFQWLLHAFVSIWWPYPFLDLASPQAPMWYLVVAVMHIPCYAIFTLIVKMMHHVLSRYFPESYLCTNGL